jgi:ATP-dependent DNA helicase RecG
VGGWGGVIISRIVFCLLTAIQAVPKNASLFFEKHHDGFKLAEKDLEIRGPGEVYGTMQSGMAELRLAKLTDRELIKKAKTAAVNIAPLIKKYPTLLKKVREWESKVHLE